MEVIDENTLRPALAANIVRLREARGLTQLELADLLGISRITLNRIENAKQIPTTLLLFSLADLFSVSPDQLRVVTENSSAA